MPTIARSETLDAQLKALPDRPGVYLFHDRDGTVLYVGKAKSLRKRVQSYFRREAYATVKTAELVERIDEIEFVGAGSEHEALLLAEPDQAAPPTVQHQAARRQVVSLHRGHGRG